MADVYRRLLDYLERLERTESCPPGARASRQRITARLRALDRCEPASRGGPACFAAG